MARGKTRVAIVHHWLVTLGGGERVLEAIASLFPDADIFTLIADPACIPASLRGRRIEQSFLARIPAAHRFHRQLLPFYPLAVEQLDLRGYDLVISSDAGPMKGVLLEPDAVHICYCHAPMRYLWTHYHDYRGTLAPLTRWFFSAAAHYVRAWDFAAAQRVTMFAANSQNVANRIRQCYAQPSTVLYPPIHTARGRLESTGNSYLAVGRLVSYKRFDLLIAACNHLKRKLRIIGSGPEDRALRAQAGPYVEFLGQVSDEVLWEEYAQCRALLFAAEEDFGMTPIEAQACGRPVIAYGRGGAVESILGAGPQRQPERSTGIFFREQTELAVSRAILEFERQEDDFDPIFIQSWAKRFDQSHFLQGFRNLVETAVAGHEHEPTDHRSAVSLEPQKTTVAVAAGARLRR
jgi:glycosyltransferase involved in cell wall biosynthesis